MKTCPICETEKELSSFGQYWSKKREKYRPQSYCIECMSAPKMRNKQRRYAKKAYKLCPEIKKQYSRDYRQKLQNV